MLLYTVCTYMVISVYCVVLNLIFYSIRPLVPFLTTAVLHKTTHYFLQIRHCTVTEIEVKDKFGCYTIAQSQIHCKRQLFDTLKVPRALSVDYCLKRAFTWGFTHLSQLLNWNWVWWWVLWDATLQAGEWRTDTQSHSN